MRRIGATRTGTRWHETPRTQPMSGPRSMMTVPANRADMLTKAPNEGADALVSNLEDSVPGVD